MSRLTIDLILFIMLHKYYYFFLLWMYLNLKKWFLEKKRDMPLFWDIVLRTDGGLSK
jgi:hypothetical protein